VSPDEDAIRARLRQVRDPDLDDDIVSLSLVEEVDIDHEAGTVRIDLGFGAPYSPAETAMAAEIREALSDIEYGVELAATVRERDPGSVLPGVHNVVAVASGKGGVGKSTVAVNLAAGLADLGARVGLFDADVYGPNAPRLLGAGTQPQVRDDETIVPPEEHGVRLMSMDFLVGPDDPVIWRGPMVHKVLTQLVEDVAWGELDYMVVDLPPGTGDTQLSMLQTVPVTGSVVVTTPQTVAVDDARKGLEMFAEHETPVLGLVENMSGFRCPDCGSTHQVFGTGGGKDLADEAGVPFLGEIPLDTTVREGGADGQPPVLAEGETGDLLRRLVRRTADMQGLVHRRKRGG